MGTMGKPVDYAKMIQHKHRVVLFGEWQHSVGAYKVEVANAIRQLSKMGFNELGMEMFPSDEQPMLDEFTKTGSNLNQVKDFLKQYWGSYEEKNGGYYQIVISAKNSGLRITGLDMPYDKYFTGSTKLKNEHFKRNKYMGEKIAKLVEKGRRVVVLMDIAHALGRNSVKSFLIHKGIVPLVIKLDGGLRCEPKDTSCIHSEVSKNAIKNSADQSRFVVPGTGASPYDSEADFIIHLPEKEVR